MNGGADRPFSRYQNRVIWLVVLLALIVLFQALWGESASGGPRVSSGLPGA